MNATTATPKLSPRMVEALLVAFDDRNQPNRHNTYIALEQRGLVEYVWNNTNERVWFITAEGRALAVTIREGGKA